MSKTKVLQIFSECASKLRSLHRQFTHVMADFWCYSIFTYSPVVKDVADTLI